MTLDEAKDLVRSDVDAYGRPKKLMTKIHDIYIAAYNRGIDDIISEIDFDSDFSLVRRDLLEKLKIK